MKPRIYRKRKEWRCEGPKWRGFGKTPMDAFCSWYMSEPYLKECNSEEERAFSDLATRACAKWLLNK